MSVARAHLPTTALAALLALAAAGHAADAVAQAASTRADAAHPPLFADVWVDGPLDSMYTAEYARLREVCGTDAACFDDGLDTTAVDLAVVRSDPADSVPAGRLMAALRARGQYPYAALLFRPTDGPDITLLEDVGDWGYTVTLPLADTADGWIRPIIGDVDTPLWLAMDGEGRGFGVMEIYGLVDHLWRLGPVDGARRDDGAPVEIPGGVYLVLELAGGTVHLRPEVPSDMACEPGQADPARVPTFTVPLDRLVGPDGLPAVAKAYPKGC